MALTRLQNIISSVEGRIIYVNPDDFDSTDAIDNKGNSPLRPFKTIARAVLEVARYSYVSIGTADDKFDQFTILLYPGDHIVDNRPSTYAYKVDGVDIVPNIDEVFEQTAVIGNYGWSDSTKQYSELYKITNSIRGGLIIPRGISIIGLDLRKTKIRPKYIPGVGTNNSSNFVPLSVNYDVTTTEKTKLIINTVANGQAAANSAAGINDLYVGAIFEQGVKDPGGNIVIDPGTTITAIDPELTGNAGNPLKVSISKPHRYTANASGQIGNVVYPYDDDTSRTALFKITGGCYFWQFSIFDGDPSGVFTSNSVRPLPSFTSVSPAGLSHSRLTVFEYATLNDLAVFYRKVADVDTIINEKFIETRIQENRIVGPLADKVTIQSVSRNVNVVTVTLNEELNLTAGNFVNIQGVISGNTTIDAIYTGEKTVASVPNRSQFTFTLTNNETLSQTSNESNSDTADYQLTVDGFVEVEIDTVESASPYIFNISMRSIYGMCGMHADGAKATGFKSMVVAQYTGISLQKIDSAFYKFDDGLQTYVAGAPGESLHTDINAIYRPSERSYHIKASNRAVIQAVSVFAVGFADHFIGENGGDLSITNSNSNFGSNALRSIGFADQAFDKDSLGRITHIIPPRNVESTETNYYWETFDTALIQTSNTRLYLAGRTDELSIRSGGTGFSTGLVDVFKNGVDTTTDVEIISVDGNGSVTSLSFNTPGAFGTLQPGDVLTLQSGAGEVDCTFVLGGSLTKTLGNFTIGARTLNTDGTAANEIVTVPLFADNTTLVQTEQTAQINTGVNVFDYDYANTNWYVNVLASGNNIYDTIATNASNRYGVGKITTTPSSFIKRVVDERIDNDKIYRLRYETTSGPNGELPSFPQTGYVIQPKKGQNILGLGDRYTDGSNLLLLNKEIMATEVIARYKAQNGGSLPGDEAACKDDLISIIETIAHDVRFGGNATTWDGANLYTNPITNFEDERSATAEIINSVDAGSGDTPFDVGLSNNFRGLRWIFNYIINNGETGAPVNANDYGVVLTTPPILITGEEQLINVAGGCSDVDTAASTLLGYYVQAIGTDSAPGNLTGITRTTFDNTATNTQVDGVDRNIYERITGHEYNDTYYIYEVEEVQPYDEVADLGVYYLTVIKGSIGIDSASVLPGNTYRLSQNVDSLYPDIDIDNTVSDPIIGKSIADIITIGRVTTTEGNGPGTTEDNSYSITKEAISSFLDEYLNNELEWIWDNKEAAGSIVTNDVYPNDGNLPSGPATTTLESGNGTSESRRVLIKPANQSVFLDVELRRPSTIRSGNHTFEYVGFGPGNYSTAFPIRQTKILSDDQIKYSQSLKEAGGIAFYSGLNSNGDLYIGNTVINAVTGKTTENQITELETLTITNNLNVIGGSGNTIATNFQGPVNFANNILGDGGQYIFSNLQLRNPSGFNTVMTAVEGNNFPVDADTADIAFNLSPTNGGHAANIYTIQNEWRPFGLVGTEKIHAYKASGSNYVVNIGSDLQTDIDSQSVVNVNYDLDVTTNQRIGSFLDIGHPPDAAIDSNTTGKQTRLQIKDNIGGGGLTEVSSIEIIKSSSNSNHKFLRFIDDQTPTPTEYFAVDTDGNVTIPTTSDYGLADRAWSITIFIAAANDAASNESTVTPLGANFFNGQVLSQFTGTSQEADLTEAAGSALGLINGFVYQVTLSLSTMRFFGTPGQLTAYTNPNSVLIFVNGVLQDTYRDAVYDPGTDKLYFNQNLNVGDRITVRGLAT